MPHRLLLQMLKNPASTGSLVPSSRFLAHAMARAASGARHIVELGAGTGPVTQALSEQHSTVCLTVVELQHSLAEHLRKRFPALDIRQACAHEVLDNVADAAPVAIVSSLPFRSLPADVVGVTVSSIVACMERNPGSWLVQFTYQPRAPFPAPPGYGWRRVATVWRNTPPAGVWVLRKTS